MADIVHGTYRKEAITGFVADFCPVCRETRYQKQGLQQCLATLRGDGWRLGREIQATDLQTALESTPLAA